MSLPPNFDAIPEELRTLRQWVVYCTQPKPNGKLDKIPHSPQTGRRASTTNAKTWDTFDAAVDAYQQQRGRAWAGIGFVFTPDDPYFGMDLDAVIDPETGLLTPQAQEMVASLATYTEQSPSGTGVHAIGIGTLPSGGRKRGHVELYDQGRFFTITGRTVAGLTEIRPVNGTLAALHRQVWGEPKTPTPTPKQASAPANQEDAEVLALAHAARNGATFSALYDRGDTSGHGADDSSADLALCNLLRFWTGGDAAQMDRLFRQSALMRDKWDTKRGALTYGQKTITLALPGDTYTPDAVAVFPSPAEERTDASQKEIARLRAENDELRAVNRGMIKVLYSKASAPAKVAQILLAIEAHTARKGSLLSHEGLSRRAHISTDVLDKARDARIGADGVFTKRLVPYKASPYTGEVHSPPVNYQVIEPRCERLSDTLLDCAENIPDILLPPVRTGQKSKKAAPKPDMPFTDREVPLCTEDPNASITVNVEPLYVARCEDCGEPLAAKTSEGAVLTSPVPFRTEQGDAARDTPPPRGSLSLNSVRNGIGKRHARNWGNPPEGRNVCSFPGCGKYTQSEVCPSCAEGRLSDWGVHEDESRAWAEVSG